MSRPHRILEPFIPMHVINRGNNRVQLFRDENDYLAFIDLAARLKMKWCVKIYHYVLMPNHVHFLMEGFNPKAISKFLQRLEMEFALRKHGIVGTSGHVWQGRYKSYVIDRDAYFLQCGKYIELNPVRASIVQHPKEYRWSSYNHYAFGEPSRLIDEDKSFFALGSNMEEIRKKYRDFVEEDLEGV